MTWNTNRAEQLPHNWNQLRQQVAAQANHQCQAKLNTGQRCPATGTECDHITPGNNHNISNLQWLCTWHHKQKTTQEAATARKKAQHKKEWHPPHPGLIKNHPLGGPPRG